MSELATCQIHTLPLTYCNVLTIMSSYSVNDFRFHLISNICVTIICLTKNPLVHVSQGLP